MIQDIKDFFESYELAHKLTTTSKNRFLYVKIATSQKGVVMIRVIEKIAHRNDNLICDAKIDGNKISLLFRLTCSAKSISNVVKQIIKPYYKVSFLGTQLKMDIYNPIVKDVQEVFTTLEKYCRRREEN